MSKVSGRIIFGVLIDGKEKYEVYLNLDDKSGIKISDYLKSEGVYGKKNAGHIMEKFEGHKKLKRILKKALKKSVKNKKRVDMLMEAL